MNSQVKLRPLEREDLRYVHKLNLDSKIMAYWFEEPYESFVELQDLFDKHIHKQNERRFIIEDNAKIIGLVELVEIDLVHRSAEFQIIIDPIHQGKGYAYPVTCLALKYAFHVLNLRKIYLIVDKENKKAIHIYKKAGFHIEGELKEEFFIGGKYRDVLRMCIFQYEYNE